MVVIGEREMFSFFWGGGNGGRFFLSLGQGLENFFFFCLIIARSLRY